MRKPVLVLSAALMASCALAVWLWQELLTQRGLNAELAERISRVDAVARQPAQATMPKLPSVALLSPVSEPVPPPPSAAGSPVNVQGSEKEWEAQRRRLFRDAKYRDAWLEERRLAYGRRRDNLIRLLGFSAAEADAIIDLTVQRELAWSQEQVNSTTMQAEEAAFQDELHAMLGEAKHRRLQSYMESRSSRLLVDQLRGEFTGADSLRDDQIEPLIAALHVEHAQARKALDEYRNSLRETGHHGNFSQLYNDRETAELRAMHQRMRDAAAAVLTFSQIERLDAILERQLERHEHELRMNKLQRKVAVQAQAQPD
jgi:hypothetical protein